MPDNLFLIPGYGSQGGAASDAVSGFCRRRRSGAIRKSSRGLLGLPAGFVDSPENFRNLLLERLTKFNAELHAALAGLQR